MAHLPHQVAASFYVFKSILCYLKMCVTLILNSVPFRNGLTNQFLWTFTIDSHFSKACESWKWHFIFNSNGVFSSESNTRFEIKYNFNCSKRNVKSNQIELQSHHLGLHALQFHSSSELIFQDKTAPPQSSNFHKVNCFFFLCCCQNHNTKTEICICIENLSIMIHGSDFADRLLLSRPGLNEMWSHEGIGWPRNRSSIVPLFFVLKTLNFQRTTEMNTHTHQKKRKLQN